MKRTLFLAAVLGSLVGLISGASAQERNELTGLIGRTFVSDQGVTGTSTPGALLTSGGPQRRSQLRTAAIGSGHLGADG
jgi:hypothetical protein